MTKDELYVWTINVLVSAGWRLTRIAREESSADIVAGNDGLLRLRHNPGGPIALYFQSPTNQQHRVTPFEGGKFLVEARWDGYYAGDSPVTSILEKAFEKYLGEGACDA